ncbi:pyridoxal-phosphate dependent enzyme [Micromonospora sp. WMMD1128]|uniref:threonine ammonia-lyase n=1 Tax=unclassified Micromonospora TaxID=2617518 RepID=UPI00248CFEDF|nr:MULTISPECIES: pyridoxal-phosphate dependent enzyme [unclassified Micromonospora]WBB71293.1 pyridoxal-phosphate dependent enzyme [Micromonospora sp. WMMD1128]WFE35237.1 pyridoxal-phosphate dependent enzyme [Micromonospora sp. WMMD975]
MTAVEAPTPESVRAAARRLAARVVTTPVVRDDELDRLAGARLWLKAECLQIGGSFKMRGALLAVGRLAGAGTAGVLAQSTGNHAIAVARAAREVGVPATVVLPTDIAPGKLRRIRAAGAEVLLAGTTLAERLAVLAEVRRTRGLDVVDPYEDPDVVAGQGSATAEMLAQVRAAGGRLDAIVLPVGGGSAVAGGCLAAEGEDVRVVAAEPAAVPALTEALRAGRPVTVRTRPTIADGLRPDRIGQLPFALARGRVADVVTVEEAEIASALCAVLMHARLLVEPAAATALAAALRLSSRPGDRCRDIGVLLSGGNVDSGLVTRLLAGHQG